MVGSGIKLPPPDKQKAQTLTASYSHGFDTFSTRDYLIQLYET